VDEIITVTLIVTAGCLLFAGAVWFFWGRDEKSVTRALCDHDFGLEGACARCGLKMEARS
jgi:hypothetical protein